MSSIEFFKLLVFSNLNSNDISLNNLSEIFETESKISISKQSLDEKLDADAVAFVKQILELLVKEEITQRLRQANHLLEQFDSVRVKDSTCFKVSGNLSPFYQASSKETGKAIIKIQYEYDLRTGKIYDISLHSYIDQDTSNAEESLEMVKLNDLIIRDLGYVTLKAMIGIKEKGAFFLNRFDMSSNAYEDLTSDNKIDFGKVQSYMKKYGLHYIEKNVFIGDKQRIPVRMVIERLPESEIEKRLRKLERLESRRNRKYSAQYRSCLELNVYVTNIPKESLAGEQISTIYRLRWQVEIVFKTWKSIGKVNLTRKMKKHRFDAMLYAKLIMLCLFQMIFFSVNGMSMRYRNKALSIYKTYKTLTNSLNKIKRSLCKGPYAIRKTLLVFIDLISKKCILEKKKGSISSVEILYMEIQKYSI